ncbi:MAG: hypothetical protein ACI89L_000894 [Phycisphaerales bacterium]|jgi:hypothetical protein
MTRKNMMLVLSGSALGLTSVASAGTPDFDRAYAAELRADTAAHTSLLQAGGSGHDGFFHIGDGSGNNRLNIGGLLQFRYVFNNRDSGDFAGTGNEDAGMGFETHHTQLNFGGNVISPNWEYGITLEFGTGDGGNDSAGSNGNVRDSWVQYNFEGDNSGTFVKFGQFVSPVLPEDAASDAVGLASSRSVANEFFSGGRIQGITLGHGNDQYKGTITLHDGMGDQAAGTPGSENTEWQSEAADYGFAARFDYKIEGDWAQFGDATSWKGSNNAFRVGGGFNYQSGGNTGGLTTAPTTDATYLLWTVDATYEGNGWNAHAAIIGNNYDPDVGLEISHTGFMVQGGYFVQDDVELFARYESIDVDSDLGLAEDTQSFLTFGGNYYLTPQSHAAKFTADFVYALSDAGALGTPGGLGLGDTGLAGGSDEELVFRAQFQLVF